VPTFVYTPKVTAFLSITNKKGKEQVIDISEDLVAGELVLRSNDVHSFNFKLQNTQRKYDGMIRPMDRIVVSMQRVGAPVRVFSGYMNDGPIFSVWPRVLSLSATCTLKRLQFWFWDSSAPKSAQLLRDWTQTTTTTGGDPTATQGVVPKTTDGGLRDLVIKILTEVVQWPKEKIHIGAIPDDWYSFATTIGNEIIKASDYSNLVGSLGGSAVVGGSGLSGAGKLAAGTYGGYKVDQEQADIAGTIYEVAKTKQLAARAAAQGIATGIVESNLRNLTGGDRDSVGVFQQRPSQGWGTVAECTDVAHAAGTFFDHLVKVPNYTTADFGLTCQAVQRSAFPDKYGKQQAAAEAMVSAMQSGAQAPNAVVGTGQGSTIGTPSPGGAGGRKMAAEAYNLIKNNPPGHIRYQMGNDDPYNSPDPKVLDCSSFVDVAYYRTVGRPLIQPRSTVSSERPKCKIIDVETAKAIKGALLFMGDHHVEVSLGNGYSAGAHTDGIPLEKQVSIVKANGFSDGGLLPDVNYADAATTPAAAQKIQSLLGYSASTSDANEFLPDGAAVATGAGGSGTQDNAANVFNSLINIYTWGYEPDLAGSYFVGPRAMMNDEPVLPFVANLMSASMRSWCSAPNGDYMAWFPDYFDLWGITAKMDVRAIELLDFTVTWSDQQIVTHQYVIGVPLGMNSAISTSGATSPTGNQDITWGLFSQGVATMDFPQIFRAIFGQDASQQFLDEYLGRFGGRPNVVTVPSVQQGRPEFFMALFLFMQRWAGQFSASVPMTFMPELWPGMILRLPEFNFQAYINQVRHSFQFGKGGYFRTDAAISAPARIAQKENDVFGLLPLGGKKYDVRTLDAATAQKNANTNQGLDPNDVSKPQVDRTPRGAS
jgi:hypothetical protein